MQPERALIRGLGTRRTDGGILSSLGWSTTFATVVGLGFNVEQLEQSRP